MTYTQETAGAIPEWTLGDRLRKAREIAELDQTALAQRMSISRAAVSTAETGRNKPRRLTIMAWAMATGVSLEWLETGRTPAKDDRGSQWYTARDLNPEPAGIASGLVSAALGDALQPALVAA